MTIDKNFIDWACSFSGCDGGDPNADIWVCGIEWGASKKEEQQYYQVKLPTEISNGAFTPKPMYDWKDSLTYTYGRSTAKLYVSIVDPGMGVGDYRDKVSEYTGREIFKLNLYPIAFNNTDDQLWREHNLPSITGFPSKYSFNSWCLLNRFPAFASRVKEYKPKVIIGTGIGYLPDFLACFAGCGNKDLEIGEEKLGNESGKQSRRFYWARPNDTTTLFVIPFFSGAYGLNSDALIQEMGGRIRQISGYSGAPSTVNP